MKLYILSIATKRVSKLTQLKVWVIISSLRVRAYDNNKPMTAGSVEELTKANAIERKLMKKLRIVNLKANQLYKA